MVTFTRFLEILAPATALTTSTAIASYSFMLSPLVESTATHASASLSFRQIRPFFEGGKYIFPPLSILDTILFLSLAYLHPTKAIGYSIAAAGCFGIIPFTSIYMIPITNNRILELDDVTIRGGGGKVDEKVDEVKRLINDFKRENYLRAGMYWVGGLVGLYTVLL